MLPECVDWARKRYEHVIIDSAPFGLVSDALALGTLSDSVVIVCRPERSRYGVVRHALRNLAESGSRIIGVVVNDVDFGRSGSFSSYSYGNYNYGYGGKYGYGGRYGRYGYSSNYYRRNVGDKSVSGNKTESESPKPSQIAKAESPQMDADGVLDIDDDE